jgi:hypothetical protein
MSATELEVVDLTPEAFSPFGTVGVPLGDGAHGRGDVALDLSQGRPRFYIMRLEGRGLGFDRMARHNRVTQCLGTTDGLPWLIAVAPAGGCGAYHRRYPHLPHSARPVHRIGARNLACRALFQRGAARLLQSGTDRHEQSRFHGLPSGRAAGVRGITPLTRFMTWLLRQRKQQISSSPTTA